MKIDNKGKWIERNQENMKKVQNVTGIAVMLLFVMAILLTSVQIAVYGDSDYEFYKKEYEKYQVQKELDMKMSDIMDVTDKMMAYLIGEREELSVITEVEGKEQDFFNEQDRFHMEEVKELFLGGLKLRNLLLVLAAGGGVILFLMKAEVIRILPRAYFIALGIFAVLTAVLGIYAALDFNSCFTAFHEIFFDNDLWIFDPKTDYMIRMLPEGFFYDFVIRICKIFVVFLAGIGILAGIFVKWTGKRK